MTHIVFDGSKVLAATCKNCHLPIYLNKGVNLWLHIDTGEWKCVWKATPE